jgi:hypothetical protein
LRNLFTPCWSTALAFHIQGFFTEISFNPHPRDGSDLPSTNTAIILSNFQICGGYHPQSDPVSAHKGAVDSTGDKTKVHLLAAQGAMSLKSGGEFLRIYN